MSVNVIDQSSCNSQPWLKVLDDPSELQNPPWVMCRGLRAVRTRRPGMHGSVAGRSLAFYLPSTESTLHAKAHFSVSCIQRSDAG